MRPYTLKIFTKDGLELPSHERIVTDNTILHTAKPDDSDFVVKEDELFTVTKGETMYDRVLFFDKISTGLVEAQTLIVLGEFNNNINTLANLYSGTSGILENNKILFYIDSEKQNSFKFFTVVKDENGDDIVKWSDRYLFDPLTQNSVQIAFVSDEEGSYEDILYICNINTNKTNVDELTYDTEIEEYGTIKLHAIAVGEDERYRSFFTNFGIPDPITYMKTFKDVTDYDKYDSLFDYQKLNDKSKELYLTYSEIFPYVGTYKALVNAVNYLGYDDIFFKEWYKELDSNSKLQSNLVSYEIPYRSMSQNNITKLPIERRILLKKLNWLSMVYKIAEETEEFVDYGDNVRIPVIRNNYTNYYANEILVKLISLKNWLEKYIIGLNCRIIDINGEGIVIERYKHHIYGKTTIGLDYIEERTLTPYIKNTTAEKELINGKATIKVGLKEYNDGNLLNNFNSVLVKAMIETKNSALYADSIGGIVDQTILIQDGEIFFNAKESYDGNKGNTSNFKILPIIQLESAKLRDPNAPWKKSILYNIDNKGTGEDKHRIISSICNLNDDPTILTKKDYISLKPYYESQQPTLKYTADNNFGVPLFMVKNYVDYELGIDSIEHDKEYILEILDGKMIIEDYDNNRTIYLNFNFDTDSNEQTVTVNYVYYSTKYNLVDSFSLSDSFDINVKNIGDYTVIVYATDNYNNVYCTTCPTTCTIYLSQNELELYTNQEYSNNNIDFFNKNTNGVEISYKETPVYDSKNMHELYLTNNNRGMMRQQYKLNDVEVIKTETEDTIIRYAKYPTMSYAFDTPKEDDIAHFMNITDKFTFISVGVSPDDLNMYRLYVRRNHTYEAYKLNDETFNSDKIEDVNFILYNNIYNMPIYQEYTKMMYDVSTGNNYLDLSKDQMRELWLYYKETDTILPLKGGDTITNLYIYPPTSVDNIDISALLTLSAINVIYIQAVYEIPVTNVYQESSIDPSTGKVVFDDTQVSVQLDPAYVPSGVQLYQKGQKVKLSFEKKLSYTITNKGQATYTVTDYKNGILFLDGYFNYDYFAETGYLYKEITEDEYVNSDNNIILNNKYYVLCGEDSGIEIDPDIIRNGRLEEKAQYFLKMVKSNDITSKLSISNAHCAYVDYELSVLDAKETSDGYTELYVKDDEYLGYIDNTFSISVMEFDVHGVYQDWMKQYTNEDASLMASIAAFENEDGNTEYKHIYKYNIPITINSGSDVVIGYNQNTMVDKKGCWKVYRYNPLTDKREFIYELWNELLFLNLTVPGIYDIDSYVFDKYGNLILNEINGIIKVK